MASDRLRGGGVTLTDSVTQVLLEALRRGDFPIHDDGWPYGRDDAATVDAILATLITAGFDIVPFEEPQL